MIALTRILSLLLIALPAAHAEALLPDELVLALIRNAHQDNIAFVRRTCNWEALARSSAAYATPEKLVRALKEINAANAEVASARAANWPPMAIVTVRDDSTYEFVVEMALASKASQEDRYIVVAVARK